MPSSVRLVSAIDVASTILRRPPASGAIAARCAAGSRLPCRRCSTTPAPSPSSRSAVRSISATPGRKARTPPLSSRKASRTAAATESSIRASAARPRWCSVSGCIRPALSITGAPSISPEKRAPSSVADIATSRRSGRSPACASSASASPKSLSRLRSWTSSNSTADTPARSGSFWMRATKIPSVTTVTRVAAERFESVRVAYPKVWPTGSPAVAAMRSAAARAARRRGESNRISPPHHASPSRAGATAVVLPAPGGATSTALLASRNVASSSGRTAWIGSVMRLAAARARRW